MDLRVALILIRNVYGTSCFNRFHLVRFFFPFSCCLYSHTEKHKFVIIHSFKKRDVYSLYRSIFYFTIYLFIKEIGVGVVKILNWMEV